MAYLLINIGIPAVVYLGLIFYPLRLSIKLKSSPNKWKKIFSFELKSMGFVFAIIFIIEFLSFFAEDIVDAWSDGWGFAILMLESVFAFIAVLISFAITTVIYIVSKVFKRIYKHER